MRVPALAAGAPPSGAHAHSDDAAADDGQPAATTSNTDPSLAANQVADIAKHVRNSAPILDRERALTSVADSQ